MEIVYKLPEKLTRKEQKEGEGGSILEEVIEYDNPLQGTVKLKLLPYRKRLEVAKEFSPELNGGEENKSDAAFKVLDYVENHVSDVKVSRKDNGYQFKDLEELGCDPDGTELINHLGEKLFEGVKLGKH